MCIGIKATESVHGTLEKWETNQFTLLCKANRWFLLDSRLLICIWPYKYDAIYVDDTNAECTRFAHTNSQHPANVRGKRIGKTSVNFVHKNNSKLLIIFDRLDRWTIYSSFSLIHSPAPSFSLYYHFYHCIKIITHREEPRYLFTIENVWDKGGEGTHKKQCI